MNHRRFRSDSTNLFPVLPFGWKDLRIYDIVEIRTSNVDKKSESEEEPVKLCNYVDVYKNARSPMISILWMRLRPMTKLSVSH